MLSKTQKFNIPIKKINYSFKVQNTNKPTKFIKIIVHHTGKNNTIQKIIDQHVKKNHWSSIGYHFMISKKGTIYYSRDLKYAGAHTFGYNKNSIGIALFGNMDEVKPTQKQITSLKNLIATLKNEFKIKKILAHNQAIYDTIKKKYWKLHLPDINPIEINTRLNYDSFKKEITTKILEHNADKETISLIKRLKNCPGFNMYKIMREIEKENQFS
jgi:hypothetical protein